MELLHIVETYHCRSEKPYGQRAPISLQPQLRKGLEVCIFVLVASLASILCSELSNYGNS